VIRFEEFGKSYGRQAAVVSLTCSVEAGEAVALLGPNGSGKTTTLKGAAGLILPTSGRVRIGEPPRDARLPDARRAISYLPQKVAFPEALTGREVLEFYRSLRGAAAERVPEVLKFASLNGSSNRGIASYSGGMVQRLGLAVALLPDAPVLLLDEPTAALDPDGLCAFYGLVEKRRAEGHTVLFTSHAERLAERGVMRLRLDREVPGLLGRIRQVAPGATRAGEELVVPGPAKDRPSVLDLVRSSGASIVNLVASEGRLDALYRELVAEERP